MIPLLQQLTFPLARNMFLLLENRFLHVIKCTSTSGKYVSTTGKNSCCRQNFVFLLVRIMFPLLGRKAVTGKNICFPFWKIYFCYWLSSL